MTATSRPHTSGDQEKFEEEGDEPDSSKPAAALTITPSSSIIHEVPASKTKDLQMIRTTVIGLNQSSFKLEDVLPANAFAFTSFLDPTECGTSRP